MPTLLKLTVTVVFAAIGISAFAQGKSDRVDLGKYEFQANCASCHGVDGKGNGPIVSQLKKAPPDLTVVAKNNGGVFPFSRLYEVIEGADVASHGTREMPVWGWEYKVQAGEYSLDPANSETFVRSRILALLEYINRLQVK
ncbi:MAG TPA: cytochrome c [Paucimonas sp.]|nr:cytochrome c [Paucimonas sp.]HJW57346.1 cytochrome c [Burkholderiaceae bacterium]